MLHPRWLVNVIVVPEHTLTDAFFHRDSAELRCQTCLNSCVTPSLGGRPAARLLLTLYCSDGNGAPAPRESVSRPGVSNARADGPFEPDLTGHWKCSGRQLRSTARRQAEQETAQKKKWRDSPSAGALAITTAPAGADAVRRDPPRGSTANPVKR